MCASEGGPLNGASGPYAESSTFHGPFKQQKYGHRQSLDGETEILTSFTACTPARGRHQLHFLPNEQETSSQQNLDRCNRRQNSRSMRMRALKIYLITTEEGFTKVQFRKSTSDRAKT